MAKQFTCLWDGFDSVYERVTSGRHDLKAFKAYLEERASIEDTYAKSLQKLAKSCPEFEVKSSISKCWTDLRDSTINLSKQHTAFSVSLVKDIGVAVEKEMQSLKKEKTDMQKQHEKVASERQKRQTNHARAFARYQEAVKQADTAVLNRDAGQKENLPEKNMRALEDRVKSCLKEVDKSHASYEDCVRALKEIQVAYDEKLREHLEKFEILERNRQTIFVDQFNKVASSHEVVKSGLEGVLMALHKGISEVTLDQDIQDFIDAREPKEQPPPHVEYTPIVSEIISHARGDAPPMSIPGGLPPNGTPNSKSVNSFKPAPPPENKAPPPILSSAPSSRPSAAGAGDKYALALYDFEASEETDLAFKTQDRIRIVDTSDPNWWKGELNGKVGTFPANYVELQNDAGAAGGAVGADQPKLMEGRCEALYDFVAQGPDELSFKAGDILHVTGELNGWYLGRTSDGSKVGIFPSNYVKMA